ncbi:MAG: hypothetical protein AAFX92_05195 [Pseudomonadota bacterium]
MRETNTSPKAGKRAQRDLSDDWHQEKQRAMRRARLERSKAAHDMIRALLRHRRNHVPQGAKINAMRHGWGS